VHVNSSLPSWGILGGRISSIPPTGAALTCLRPSVRKCFRSDEMVQVQVVTCRMDTCKLRIFHRYWHKQSFHQLVRLPSSYHDTHWDLTCPYKQSGASSNRGMPPSLVWRIELKREYNGHILLYACASLKEGNKDTMNKVVNVLLVFNRFRSRTRWHGHYMSLEYQYVCYSRT